MNHSSLVCLLFSGRRFQARPQTSLSQLVLMAFWWLQGKSGKWKGKENGKLILIKRLSERKGRKDQKGGGRRMDENQIQSGKV